MQEALILGLLAFFMALVVLSFFGSVMLNIVDAVFICYALDRDTQTVSHPDVHDVFSQVSSLECWCLSAWNLLRPPERTRQCMEQQLYAESCGCALL